MQNIDQGIWRVEAGSNVYLLLLDEPIVIDTGQRKEYRKVGFLKNILPLEKVAKVIFTHLHYDHIGNFDLFPNATFYASSEAIKSFQEDPQATVLDQDMAEKFKQCKLYPIEELQLPEIEVIHTPGHTKGSICLYMRERELLFSGDTIFAGKKVGRTDLPTSLPEEMQDSLIRLIDYKFTKLCPGH